MDGTSHPAAVALSAAIVEAAHFLGVPLREISVASLEGRDWPDSCLGLAQDGVGCMDVVTPGFIVFLGEGLCYRTDTIGNVRRDADHVDTELNVHFRQVGGIGGWASEFYGDDASLSTADSERIRRFIDSTDFFPLSEEVGNGEPIPDQFTYTIFLAHGRRHHTVTTFDGSGPHESPSLAEFIVWLKARSPEPGPFPSGRRPDQ